MASYALQSNDNYSQAKGGMPYYPFYNCYVIDADTAYPQTQISITGSWIKISSMVNCSIIGDAYDCYILPDNAANYKDVVIFSFEYKLWISGGVLVCNDEIFTGAAYGTLPETNLSLDMIRGVLGISSYSLKDLCTDTSINEHSLVHWIPSGLPGHPNKLAPYKIGDFRCYSHNYPEIVGRPYVNVYWSYTVQVADPEYVCYMYITGTGIYAQAANQDNSGVFRMYNGDTIQIQSYIVSGPSNPAIGIVVNDPLWPLESWDYQFNNLLFHLDYTWVENSGLAWNEQVPIYIGVYNNEDA
jgi:hypothetical protein